MTKARNVLAMRHKRGVFVLNHPIWGFWPYLVSWWFNLVLFFFLSVPLLAQVLNPHPDYASTVENLRAYLRDQMGRDHVKGLSLALVDGDKIVWSEGFGYADDRAKVPATADTLYRLDFVTKLFTAVEIMRLNAKGRLGLDDPLGADLPGFSIHNRFKRAKPITIRSLLAHHSGLPADYHQGMWAEEPGTLAQLVKDLRDDYLAAPPQAFYKYSDLDYDLLGRIIELKDHKPYAQALRENLLEPLGMVSSTFELDPADQVKLAKGYDKGRETAPLHLRDLPAGGLLSSANDMARFIRFFFTRKPALVPAKALDLMFREQYPGIPLDFGHYQGLGWMLDGLEMENYRDMAWHDGDYGPYFCRVALLRDEKLGVVVMANTMESHEMGRDTALRALKLMREEKYGIPANLVKPKAVMPKLITVPEEKLGKYVGDYAGIGKAAVITRDGAHLRGDLMGHQFDLVPTTGNKFIPRVMILFFPIHLPEYTVDFETVGGRDVIILGGLGAPVVFEKIKPVPIPEAWHQWLGRYRLDDPDGQTKFENMTLEAKGGLLTFNARISSKVFNVTDTDYQINLEPISDEDAIVSGLVSPDGDTVHLYRQDGQVRIYYAGLRFTKVEETTK